MEYMTFANIIHIVLWVSQFVHTTTKGHVLHKQLLHYTEDFRLVDTDFSAHAQ